MVQQLDGKEVKKKILDFLENHGPGLPVQISRFMQMNTLFVGAFLSEMASEKTIIISDMKVGGSPLYFTLSKKQMLENFNKFLNPKEREAQVLLKEKQILKDSEQHPAIRVALRGLKDFAYGFQYNDAIFWRYFTISEDEAVQKIKDSSNKTQPTQAETPIIDTQIEIKQETKKENNVEGIKQDELQLMKQSQTAPTELDLMKKELLEKQNELEKMREELQNNNKEKNERNDKIEAIEKSKTKPKLKPKKASDKDNFLNEIKDYCIKKGIDIKKVESFDKKQVYAIIISEGKEYLLGAFNKRKTEESDILKTHKKSLAFNIPYRVISKGEAPKKAKETIEAYKNLISIDKLEQNSNF